MDPKENDNTIILDDISWDQPNAASEIYISDFDNMLSVSGAAMPTLTINNQGTGSPGLVWDDFTINSTMCSSNTMQLNGEGADIVVNGESLMDTLRGIQDRLNILRPNLELEAEWDELREAGERYRELERQFAEKSKVWKALKD